MLAILELERFGQEVQEFEFSVEYTTNTLSYTVRPCLKEEQNYAKIELNTTCRSGINRDGGLSGGMGHILEQMSQGERVWQGYSRIFSFSFTCMCNKFFYR